MTTEGYQQFIRDSNCHREAIIKRLAPLRRLVDLALDENADPAEIRIAAAMADDRVKTLEIDLNMIYGALGLAGEAGEYADKLKKHLRGDDGRVRLSDERRKGLQLELGDVQWYTGDCADSLGSDLDEIMSMNQEKIARRVADGTRKGDGDHR